MINSLTAIDQLPFQLLMTGPKTSHYLVVLLLCRCYQSTIVCILLLSLLLEFSLQLEHYLVPFLLTLQVPLRVFRQLGCIVLFLALLRPPLVLQRPPQCLHLLTQLLLLGLQTLHHRHQRTAPLLPRPHFLQQLLNPES